MKITRKLAMVFSMLMPLILTACVTRILFHRGVNPQDIRYDKVPGYGPAGGSEILEWAQKSSVTPGEKTVTATLKAQPGLSIRWLGAAGFEISDETTTILIDPFVTRPSGPDSFNPFKPLKVDTRMVDKYVLKPIRESPGGLKKIKAILISHTHDDHVLDAPYVLAQFPKASDRPLIVGDHNLKEILAKYSGQEGKVPWLKGIDPLDQRPPHIIEFTKSEKLSPGPNTLGKPIPGQFGDFTITAFISEHALYDDIPFNHEGGITGRAPFTGADLRAYLNSTLTYLVEYKGLRIFAVDSPRFLHPDRVSAEVMKGGGIDVILEGIASRKAKDDDGKLIANDIPLRIKGLQPRYFIPTHFDDFFVPLSQFKEFDYEIRIATDTSDLKGFIDGFKTDSCLNADPCPSLRMMKMFYYYSLDNLLPETARKRQAR